MVVESMVGDTQKKSFGDDHGGNIVDKETGNRSFVHTLSGSYHACLKAQNDSEGQDS